MGKPVNLNRFRKARARADAKARADENAVKFGRSRAEKELDQARQERVERVLDDHKRDPDG